MKMFMAVSFPDLWIPNCVIFRILLFQVFLKKKWAGFQSSLVQEVPIKVVDGSLPKMFSIQTCFK